MKNAKAKTQNAMILCGPPGSGKSTFGKKHKNYVNFDFDEMIAIHPNMIKLEKQGVQADGAIESCSSMVGMVIEELMKYCADRRINFIIYRIFDELLDITRFLKSFGYEINTYYMYTKDSYKRATKRDSHGIGKAQYKGIINEMDPFHIYYIYVSSDTFTFIDTTYTPPTVEKIKRNLGSWATVFNKIKSILTMVEKNIK